MELLYGLVSVLAFSVLAPTCVTIGKQALSFPYDLDTTSLGLTVIKRDEEVANSVMDEMLEYVSADGIIQA
jgi:hypothetical protein